MNVVWTDSAKRRLRLIHDYVAQHAPDAADNVVRRVLRRSRQIAEFPQSGRQVPELDHPDIREVLERPYRIIYLVRVDQIDVLTVMHARQLLPGDLEITG